MLPKSIVIRKQGEMKFRKLLAAQSGSQRSRAFWSAPRIELKGEPACITAVVFSMHVQ